MYASLEAATANAANCGIFIASILAENNSAAVMSDGGGLYVQLIGHQDTVNCTVSLEDAILRGNTGHGEMLRCTHD